MSDPLYKKQVISDQPYNFKPLQTLLTLQFQVISEPRFKHQVILGPRYNFERFQTHHTKIKSFKTPYKILILFHH